MGAQASERQDSAQEQPVEPVRPRTRARRRRRAWIVVAVVAGLTAVGVAAGLVLGGGSERRDPSASGTGEPTATAPSSPPPTATGIEHGDRLSRADFTGTLTGVFRSTQPEEVAAYEQWLGRPVDLAEDNSSNEDWYQISNPGYLLDDWGPTGRRLVLGIAMLPTEDPSATIEQGAQGAYDDWYRQLGQNLVEAGQEDAVLRVGWEFNLDTSYWQTDDAEAWKAYYRRIVQTLLATPGQQFRFDWNPNNGAGNLHDAVEYYPGDDVVDYIGLDAYDTSGGPGTYPIPAGCTGSCADERRQRAWDDQVYGGERGLRFWSEFARQHDKMMSLPEWGVWAKEDGTGGGDNAIYINDMADFIEDPDNAVAYESYFEDTNSMGTHRLSLPGQFPEASAAFLERFGGAAKG